MPVRSLRRLNLFFVPHIDVPRFGFLWNQWQDLAGKSSPGIAALIFPKDAFCYVLSKSADP